MAEYGTTGGAATFAKVDWKDEVSVKRFLDDAQTRRLNRLNDRDRQAEINIAWYRGHQETRWHAKSRRLIRLPNPGNRIRVIINLMQPLIDGYIAKVGLDPVHWEALPATGDSSDYDTARRATQVLGAYEHELNAEAVVSDVDRWAVLTGQAFVKVCWDATAGKPIQFGPDDLGLDQKTFDREFGSEIGGLREGAPVIRNVPIFNIDWGPEGVAFEDADWVLEYHERSRAECMDRYGLKADEIDTAYDEKVRVFRLAGGNAYGTMAGDPDPEIVLVRELWVKANPAINGLERGRHVVLVGSKMVQSTPNPYRHGKIPIVDWSLYLPPGQVRGETFVDQLIAPQADVNVNVSQQCENRELVGHPVWLAQSGSIPNLPEWIARPGGIRFYKGNKPELTPGQSMPAAVIVQLNQTVKFMQDIVGLHDVSQGKAPSAVRSGRGILALKEGDDERMGPIVRDRRNLWARVGGLLLDTIAQYVREDRLVRVMGDENRWETVSFRGAMLRPDGGGSLDVRVQSNGAVQSRSAKQEAMMFLVERGFLKPDSPEDRTLVLDTLEFGNTRGPLDPTRDDRARQQFENEMMARGQYVQPQHYEDHEAHLAELNRFRRKQSFLQLPPQIQALFDQHEMEHIGQMALRQFRIQAAAQQAMMQAGVLPPEQPQGQLPPPQEQSPQENAQQPLEQSQGEMVGVSV